jgi:uncharacterized membrane protein YdjX (TVP38/TMEM64 family)
MTEPNLESLRKRILMFYFAAGLNLVMGLFVLSAGGGAASQATIWLIALVFVAFAGLNYYLARVLRKRWEFLARQQR